MLDAKWEAVVKLALIQEPRLGEKLMPLRAIKETKYNITVGSHDKAARDAATHMIGAYTEAINKITTAVWGEARGIKVEECAPPAGDQALPPPPASSLASAPATLRSAPIAASAFAAPPPAPAPAQAAPPSPQPSPRKVEGVPPRAPAPVAGTAAQATVGGSDAVLAGLLDEMRKKLRAEIESEVRGEAERSEQGLRQSMESEVAAAILETNKKAELQDLVAMIVDGKQLVQEVWQIWANLETLVAQSKDEELMKHIFVAEEKLHALVMLASRLLPVAVVEDRVHKSTHKK